MTPVPDTSSNWRFDRLASRPDPTAASASRCHDIREGLATLEVAQREVGTRGRNGDDSVDADRETLGQCRCERLPQGVLEPEDVLAALWHALLPEQ